MSPAVDLQFYFEELDDLKKRLGGIVQVNPRAAEYLEDTRTSILSDIECKIKPLEDKDTKVKTTEDRNTGI
jgi:hypothetical protein